MLCCSRYEWGRRRGDERRTYTRIGEVRLRCLNMFTYPRSNVVGGEARAAIESWHAETQLKGARSLVEEMKEASQAGLLPCGQDKARGAHARQGQRYSQSRGDGPSHTKRLFRCLTALLQCCIA